MKEEIVQFAKVHNQKIINDTSLSLQDKLYQLSMPLLALATLKDSDAYGDVLSNMELIIKGNEQLPLIQKPWQLWMLGRMALASKLADDKLKLAEFKEMLSIQLFENDNKDVITGWAFAYLAAIDKSSYEKYREKLFEYSEFARNNYKSSPTTEASNFVWTLVMNLYASASAENKEDYLWFLHELKILTEMNSLKEATLLVPKEDYRQWLVSMARYSFTIMKDETSLNELININEPKIESLDSMLAVANEILLSAFALNKTNNPYSFYAQPFSENHKEFTPNNELNPYI
ncbi:MAG: hypothetical protein H0U70_02655 [Tatlockia sp.]|nr:hypothetical protein [Tatlockia sp.]